MSMSVEICNMCLISLGADPIISITENSENARKLNVIYVPVLKDLLRLHPWNFALRRASLAQLTETPAFGYTYYYQLPSDYLRAVKINGQETIDYVIEGDWLLCDEETVNLNYIAYIDDPNLYDTNFKLLLANRLAAEIALGVTGSRTITADRWTLYNNQLRVAKSSDGQEGKPQKIENHNWKDSRS